MMVRQKMFRQLKTTVPLSARHSKFNQSQSTLVDTTFRATELHVRWAIGHSLEKLGSLNIPTDMQFTFEIVLAELLNNIVEHGYKGMKAGDIRLVVTTVEDRLCIETIDHGVQMPGLRAPHPPEPDLDVSRDDLPEGSFGWFMIRKLVEDLDYNRVDNENRLSLFIAQ